ncbi:MAG TPA: response regulator [Steroidobacteraceae bacterium]|nr:response regulator [Steroidobacteraceae bacterium]
MTSAEPTLSPTGLLVDDDRLYLQTLQRSLRKRGVHTAVATTLAAAIELANTQPLEFALVDLRLGSESGLELIEPLRRAQPRLRIVLMTGYASVATAVEAIKRGADHYLLKPTTVDTILRTVMAGIDTPPEPQPTMTPLSRLEWEHIHQALAETNGNVSAAARLLGMHRRSLQRKLAKRPGPERKPCEPED